MTTRSAKAKGKRLQNLVRDELLTAFSSLQPEDIKVAISSEGGEDVKLSPVARSLIPYSFECKNTERIQIWKAIEQAQSNANGHIPVVVFSRNRTEPFVVISLEKFIKLIKR